MSRRLVESASKFLDSRVSRRGFLRRAAWVGTALVAAPATYLFRPVTAEAAVIPEHCGPGTRCRQNWTEFCVGLPEHGVNTCPPGSMIAGWWRADRQNSSQPVYCGTGSRYYMDCNASTCSCGCGSSGTCAPECTDFDCRCANDDCNRWKTACTRFRYGQCNNHHPCLGPIVCRVVTCVPPWEWDDSCTKSLLVSHATYTHPPTTPRNDDDRIWIGNNNPAPAKPARAAVVRGNVWTLRNGLSSGGTTTFTFGQPGDFPVMGDFSNSGVRTAAIVRNARHGVAGNEDLIWFIRQIEGPGEPELIFRYGRAGDFPVVGDWNGDGVATVGFVRGDRWYLRNSNSPGNPQIEFRFGGWQPGDIPVVGDWWGDGRTGVGYARVETEGRVLWRLRRRPTTGHPQREFYFGSGAGGFPVTGDWNGDGITGVGWVVDGTWQVRNAFSDGPPAATFSFGDPNGIPVTWSRQV